MCVAKCQRINLAVTLLTVLGGIFNIADGSVPPALVSKSGRPCDLHDAIVLPQTRQCLVTVRSAYNWTKAHSICEMAKGNLYQIPIDIQVRRQNLLNCLFSMPNSPDVWISPITELLPQFRWLNGSAIYPIDFCPYNMPPSNTSGPSGVTLTMDSCIARCRNVLAEYAFMSNTKTRSSCHCANQLEDSYKVPCDTSTFSLRNATHYFISRTTNESRVKINQETFVTNEKLLCGSLDNHTLADQQIKSFPCSHRLPFICDLGTGTDCPRRLCGNVNCVFPWQGACLRRVDHPLNWHEAHAFCNTSGGVLWQMDQLPVLTGFSQHISPEIPYWIGASNFVLENQTNSVSLETFAANFLRVLCGNMYLVEPEKRWQWDYTTCDQAKSFLCQYDLDATDSRHEEGQEVICPWNVGSTSMPVTISDPILPPSATVHIADSFPVAALLSGIVAGLLFLICVTACCACCCDRRMGKKRDPKVALMGYIMDSQPTVLGYDTQGIPIRSVGSQTGGDSERNGFGSHVGSCDRMSKGSREQPQMNTEEIKSMTCEAHTSHDVPTIEPHDYMTLEGKIDIQEEAAEQDLSLPDKPEVTLVTDNVDLNFTVNNAKSCDHINECNGFQNQAVDEVLPTLVSEKNFESPLPAGEEMP